MSGKGFSFEKCFIEEAPTAMSIVPQSTLAGLERNFLISVVISDGAENILEFNGCMEQSEPFEHWWTQRKGWKSL